MIDVTLASVLRPGVALLGGERGSGRTTLALELAAAAHSDGGDVLYITDAARLTEMLATFERIQSEGVTRSGTPASLLPPSFISLPQGLSETHVAVMEQWIGAVRHPSLVVLDPLRVDAEQRSTAAALSAVIAGLAALALSAHPLTILGIVTLPRGTLLSGMGDANQVLLLREEQEQRRLHIIEGSAPSGQRILAYQGGQWAPVV